MNKSFVYGSIALVITLGLSFGAALKHKEHKDTI